MITEVFFRLLNSSKLDQGISSRFLRRHPSSHIFLDVHFQVTRQFLFQFAIQLLLADQPAQSDKRTANPVHEASSFAPRNRASITVACSHSRASFSNCLR